MTKRTLLAIEIGDQHLGHFVRVQTSGVPVEGFLLDYDRHSGPPRLGGLWRGRIKALSMEILDEDLQDGGIMRVRVPWHRRVGVRSQ